MIKGVNKKVIEINRPDSAYFERAVLYLKPDVTEVPMYAAQAETDSFFDETALSCREPRKRWFGWGLFFLGMITSGGVFWLVAFLLH